ncbi:MAG: CoA ester lyase, partial [Chloroflexi bacterium]|nr:CoA ester lyase [Chloroflexota bacterium]
MRRRRALLYVPADQERKIRKAAGLEVDSVCLDLEDGVRLERKAAARATLRQIWPELDWGPTEVLVRINAPTRENLHAAEEDLHAVLPLRPSGIVIPKVEAPWQLHWVAYRVQRAEEAMGLPTGAIRLLAILETARGVEARRDIARATSRLDALLFGAEDLAADLGAQRSPDNTEVLFARQAVLLTAKAHGLQALDLVYIQYRDLEGLEREAREAAQWGFDGKQVIHPAQVPVVQAAFTPTPEAIEAARRVLEAYRQAQAQGLGVIGLDGRMIDRPMLEAARRVLRRAG